MLLLETHIGSRKEETFTFSFLYYPHFPYSCPFCMLLTVMQPLLWWALHFDGQIDKLQEELQIPVVEPWLE